MHKKITVDKFHKNHFPIIPGVVCKKCSDEFIEKVTKNIKDYIKKLSSIGSLLGGLAVPLSKILFV